jgi:hypothetical protein
MKSFIKDNTGNYINLDNVSNIGFIPEKNRIIINFNYSISLSKSSEKKIADYRYLDFDSQEEFEEFVTDLCKMAEQKFYIMPNVEEFLDKHWVNPRHISYLNTDVKKNRIIFNMTNPITKLVNDELRTINDFVFWDFDTLEKFEEALKEVSDIVERYE